MTSGRQGFNAQTVMRLTDLTHRKLVYLDKTGLVKPSIRPATGSGSRRVYSFEDLVGVRAVAEMRRAGLSLQAVRGVVEHLRKRNKKPLARLSLTLQGTRVFVRTDTSRTLEELTAGGQLTMFLPVEEIVRQLNEKVTEIGAPQTFTVRVAGRDYHAVATPDLEAGGFSIKIPALPGCFAEADTIREAKREARESIEAILGAGVAVGTSARRAAR
jgi:DNA-binding transcriptional MerR regulator